jgi:hypothetical protein
MRQYLRYGVPAAAGLATGGYALSQGEDPGSAGLAAIAGGLGGGAGLLGARALAGKYGQALPGLVERGLNKSMGQSNRSIRERVNQGIVNSPEYMSRGQAATLYDPKTVGNIARTNLLGLPATLNAAAFPGAAAAAVPLSAGLAGLGGVALGGAIGATGLPGFQEIVNPEAYQSGNMPGARQSITTQSIPSMQYS